MRASFVEWNVVWEGAGSGTDYKVGDAEKDGAYNAHHLRILPVKCRPAPAFNRTCREATHENLPISLIHRTESSGCGGWHVALRGKWIQDLCQEARKKDYMHKILI
jgi:hypothetical protein